MDMRRTLCAAKHYVAQPLAHSPEFKGKPQRLNFLPHMNREYWQPAISLLPSGPLLSFVCHLVTGLVLSYVGLASVAVDFLASLVFVFCYFLFRVALALSSLVLVPACCGGLLEASSAPLGGFLGLWEPSEGLMS